MAILMLGMLACLLLISSIYAAARFPPCHTRALENQGMPQELGQVCSLVPDESSGRNVLPEPEAQMASGDRLHALCSPQCTWDLLSQHSAKAVLPRACLGNGMECTNQVFSQRSAISLIAATHHVSPCSPTTERREILAVRSCGFLL